MGSPSAVITLGYGSWGSVNEVVTLGFGVGAAVPGGGGSGGRVVGYVLPPKKKREKQELEVAQGATAYVSLLRLSVAIHRPRLETGVSIAATAKATLIRVSATMHECESIEAGSTAIVSVESVRNVIAEAQQRDNEDILLLM